MHNKVRALGAFLLGIAFVWSGCQRQDPVMEEAKKALKVVGEVPDFTAENYDGRVITKQDLLGNVWVVDFFFTSCGGPCPIMSSQLSVLQSEFADVTDFKVVSFTVDPDTDTPEVLKKYAAKYGAKPDKWYFLRMDLDKLIPLAEKGFRVAPPVEPAAHATHFILVDRWGRIRGYYPGTDTQAYEKLAAMVKLLLNENEPA